MTRDYHKGRGLTIADLGLSLEELKGQPLELFAREGARVLLTLGLEAEVADFLDRGRYERSPGVVKGYRNGHRERRVLTGAGEIAVAAPQGGRRGRGFPLSPAGRLGETQPGHGRGVASALH